MHSVAARTSLASQYSNPQPPNLGHLHHFLEEATGRIHLTIKFFDRQSLLCCILHNARLQLS